MAAADWLMLAGAATAIALVNWYFFIAGRTPVEVAAPASGGMPEIEIIVDGGYSPNSIRVHAGRPVRLVFDRRDDSSCSEELVFPAFGIRKFLPAGERTTIEIVPPAAGSYPFTCGMGMLRGTIVADA